MKKLLGLMLLLVLTVGTVSVTANADECTATGGGASVCTQDNGGVVLEGDAGNPEPFGGFIQVNGDGTYCVSGEGNYDDEDASCDFEG